CALAAAAALRDRVRLGVAWALQLAARRAGARHRATARAAHDAGRALAARHTAARADREVAVGPGRAVDAARVTTRTRAAGAHLALERAAVAAAAGIGDVARRVRRARTRGAVALRRLRRRVVAAAADDYQHYAKQSGFHRRPRYRKHRRQ